MENKIKLLKSKLKKLKYDAVLTNSIGSAVAFENDNLKKFETNQANSVSLRLFNNKRIGYCSMSDLNKFDFLIETAMYNSKYGEKIDINLPEKFPAEFNPVNYYHSLDTIDFDYLINRSKKLIKKIKQKDSKFFVNINFGTGIVKSYLINSNELLFKEKNSSFNFGAYIMKIRNNSLIEISDSYIYPYFKDEIDKVENKIIEYINYYENENSLPKGKYNIILTPETVSSIIGCLIMGINGRNIEKKISPLTDKLNKKLISEKLTIVEDPDLKDCVSSTSCDDEGIMTKKKLLFEKGIVRNFIYDLITAKKLKVKPEGNGYRCGGAKTSPGLSNIILNSGVRSIKEIKEDLNEYVLIDGFIGAGQSNILAGDFSANIEPGFYFKNNKISYRLKNNMIAFNIYKVLRDNLIELSADVENLGSRIFPYMILKEINIV